MDLSDIKAWLDAGKTTLDIFKSARDALPKGPERDNVTAQITKAEDNLQRSDVALAQSLGYRLCECTFPPQIMLWKEALKARVCPNPECGRAIGSPKLARRVAPSFG